jgi:hypothetical protein
MNNTTTSSVDMHIQRVEESLPEEEKPASHHVEAAQVQEAEQSADMQQQESSNADVDGSKPSLPSQPAGTDSA